MTVRNDAIPSDPRSAKVSEVVGDLCLHASSVTTEKSIYAAVADALFSLLEIDRLSIEMNVAGSDTTETVFEQGAPRQTGLTMTRSPGLEKASLLVIDDGSIARTDGYRQVAIGPVRIDDDHLGRLELFSTDGNRFSGDDLWIVDTISLMLGHFLAASRHRRREGDDSTVTGSLREIDRLISSLPTPRDVSRHVAERIGRSLVCDVLIMHNDDGLWVGDDPYVRDPSRTRSQQALLDRLTRIRQPVQLTPREFEGSGNGKPGSPRTRDDLVSRIEELLASEDIDQSVVLPFPADGEPSRILVALRTNRGDTGFSAEDLEAIERDIWLYVPAMSNATLRNDLASAHREREAVRRLSTAIGSSSDLEDRIRVACRTAQLLISCDYVALVDWNTQPPNMRFVIGSEVQDAPVLSRAGTITAVRRSGSLRIINDFPNAPPVKEGWYPLHVAERLRASLTFRLQWSGKTFGSLILGYRKPRHFHATDLRFSESMAQTIVACLGGELSSSERRDRITLPTAGNHGP